MKRGPHIMILAAGRGSRMRSARAKILHPVLFRPMIHYVLDLAKSLPHRSLSMVVGHGESAVREECRGYDVRFFHQSRQLGTAHAVRSAEAFLREQDGALLILSGDVILLRDGSLRELLSRHAQGRADATIATTRVSRPRGYGRVIRHEGRIVGIREDVDCSETERTIDEVNGGVYCFAIRPLLEALAKVGNHNGQGEYYLSDVVRFIAEAGGAVLSHPVADCGELHGVNDLAALSEAEAEIRRRHNRELMLSGVRLLEPATTLIDPRCRFGREVIIEGGVCLVNCDVGDGVLIESGSRLIDTRVGEAARIKQGSYLEKSVVGARGLVGPYAHLRAGTRLADDVRIGNFVEIKNSSLGAGTKASHLSYIGDAQVGRGVNIGCGFITCNFDGVVKHQTIIEDDAFIGSDSQAIAPVRIGAGSYVASGSTITADVPSEALAIARARQTVKPGYARKYRERQPQHS